MTLGEIIKTYRKKHKISQIEFAEKANLTKGYISMLENNYNPSTQKPIMPSVQVVLDVAKAMNISANTLLDLMDNEDINLQSSVLVSEHLTEESNLKAMGLSDNEIELLFTYREIDSKRQAELLSYASYLRISYENSL